VTFFDRFLDLFFVDFCTFLTFLKTLFNLYNFIEYVALARHFVHPSKNHFFEVISRFFSPFFEIETHSAVLFLLKNEKKTKK